MITELIGKKRVRSSLLIAFALLAVAIALTSCSSGSQPATPQTEPTLRSTTQASPPAVAAIPPPTKAPTIQSSPPPTVGPKTPTKAPTATRVPTAAPTTSTAANTTGGSILPPITLPGLPGAAPAPSRPSPAPTTRVSASSTSAATTAAATPISPVQYEKASAEFQANMARLEKLQARIPKGDFDPKAKAAELGPDVNAVFRFVRDDIAFEAYAGVLRGATGTLVGRAGNSLDKSILLAELLKANGRTVRFARGQLDGAQAETLVNQMFAKPAATNTEAKPDASLLQDLGMSEDEYKALVAEQEASSTAFFTDLLKGLDEEYATIQGALAANNVRLDNVVDSRRQAVEETRDHFWVQYKDGDKWVDLDPTSTSSTPGDRLVASSVATYETLPTDLYHAVTFEVTMERMKGTEFQTTSLLKRSFKSADLFGTGVRFYNLPNLPPDDSSLKQMDKVSKFLPILVVTDTLQYDQGFDLQGNTVVGEAFKPDFVGSTAGAAGDLGDALMHLIDPTPSAVTAEWFDIRIKSPGQPDKAHRRTIVDRIGAENRTNGRPTTTSLKLDFRDEARTRYLLMRSFTILVDSVFVREDFVASKLLDQLLKQKALWAETLKLTPAPYTSDAQLTKIPEAVAEDQQTLCLLMFSTSTKTLIDQIRELHPDIVTYQHVPNVYIYATALDRRSDRSLSSEEYFDIVENSLRTLRSTGATELIVETSLRIGVGQGYLERALMQMRAASRITAMSTSTLGASVGGPHTTVDVFLEARNLGLAISVVQKDDLQRLSELRLSESAQAGIRSDIERGYLVIVPKQGVSRNDGEIGWWRVNPENGAVVGIMDPGLGGSVIEEILLTLEVLRPAFVFSATFLSCGGWQNPANLSDTKFWFCYKCSIISGSLSLIRYGEALKVWKIWRALTAVTNDYVPTIFCGAIGSKVK